LESLFGLLFAFFSFILINKILIHQNKIIINNNIQIKIIIIKKKRKKKELKNRTFLRSVIVLKKRNRVSIKLNSAIKIKLLHTVINKGNFCLFNNNKLTFVNIL